MATLQPTMLCNLKTHIEIESRKMYLEVGVRKNTEKTQAGLKKKIKRKKKKAATILCWYPSAVYHPAERSMILNHFSGSHLHMPVIIILWKTPARLKD